MKKKSIQTAAACLAGASAVLGTGVAMAAGAPEQQQVAEAAAANASSLLDIAHIKTVAYDKIANVKGEFRFDQSVITPSDEVFSLFGTAATGICARPGFVFEEGDVEEHYINISGQFKKIATISLAELKEKGREEIMKCSCSMSKSVANAEISGVPLKEVMELSKLGAEINTVTVRGSDGYGVPMPLSLALKKGAMLVYAVGGAGLAPENGGPVQLWMPGTVAQYFTRQVTDIEFTALPEEPAMLAPEAEQRAKVAVLNCAEGIEFHTGDAITFEGYADDFGTAIQAVEFSMDGGATWTAFETPDASVNRWVYWYFDYMPEKAGSYKLDVRAKSADGTVSPLCASVVFAVK